MTEATTPDSIQHPSADRVISLRFAGTCTNCGTKIPKGARATYSPASRSVRHVVCAALDHGTAGSSAIREYERRKTRDDKEIEAEKQRVRDVFGDGLMGKIATFLAVDDRPRRSTSVWAQGAIGEEAVAARLDALAEVGVVALHDRRIPGTRANIDHLVITPWGVWVIDAKRYLNKRPDYIVEGGLFGFGGTARLTIGGRKRDDLVDGVLRQIERVESALDGAIQVGGILCFVEADWPLIGGDFTVRGIEVCWPKKLAKSLLQASPPTIDAVALARTLATVFPPA